MRLSLFKDLSLQIIHPAQERLAKQQDSTSSTTLFEQWCGPSNKADSGDSQLTCQAYLAAGCHFAVYPDQ